MMDGKKLFLDFDNMMAHSLYASDESHADQLLYDYDERWVGEKFEIPYDGWVVSFKRSWTNDLLTFTRQLMGNDNVFILTTGTLDYIRWCNIKLDLGFDPNTNIFGREDIMIQKTHPKFTNTYNVLVDDLSYGEHSYGSNCKVKFLNNIPKKQFVKVEPFTVYSETLEYDSEYFENLKDRIMRALC